MFMLNFDFDVIATILMIETVRIMIAIGPNSGTTVAIV